MNNQEKAYFFPGLGFDSRIFRNLSLSSSHSEFLNWQEPEKRESLENYATRLSENIVENSTLIGHSFGGILSQEIARIKKIKKVILISSIRSRDELPGLFRTVHRLHLHPLFTKKNTFSTFKYWAEEHAYDTEEKQQLFKDMVGGYSNNYLQWALKNLSAWKGVDSLETPVIQIHGDCDKTFPIKFVNQPDYKLRGGTHMMVFDRGEEISKLILRELNE